jgi:prepilin-type N-terminal cleavage/methylation domain-containing protein
MKSLSAFTLIELLISMVISTLVISMAYAVYHRSENSFRDTFDEYCRTNDMLQLQVLLNRDCSDAWCGRLKDDRLELECLNHKMVNYMILSNKIVRGQDSKTDTFKVGKIEYQASYLFDKPPIIDQVNLTVESVKGLSQNILIQLHYTDKPKFEITESARIKEETSGY